MLQGFVIFSMGYTGLSGILGLLIGVPLAATGVLDPTAPKALFGGMMAGVSVLFLAWAGIMFALYGGFSDKDWNGIGGFRKFLLLLMSTPMLYVGAYLLFGILIALLVFGALILGSGVFLQVINLTLIFTWPIEVFKALWKR